MNSKINEDEIFEKEKDNENNIENGKTDVKKLLKQVFENFIYTKQHNIKHIDYKMSIYNNSNWLDKPISNIDYSDLLGCMLDIEENFENVKDLMDDSLSRIKKFKKVYFKDYEETEEYEKNEEEEEL